MQALFSLGVTIVAATSIMLFYVFDKSTTPEETPLIGDNMLKDLDDKGEKLKEAIDGKPSGFQMDIQEKQKGENENLKKMDEAKAAAQVKQKEEAERQEKAKEAVSQAKLKEEAGRQKKAKEAEATAQAKQKEEAERQKKVRDAADQVKLKEESERQKKAKEAAAQAKLKEESERQKKAKEAAAQAKLKEEAERQKKAKEAAAQAKEAAAQAKLKEESERQKKAKEAAVQAKLKEEAESQKKAKEAAAQAIQKEEAQAKLKEESERQKKAKEAAVQAKLKEEAESQKKAKEAAAQAIQKEEAQAKLKEESERQKKAKEAAAQAKLKEESERQKKAKEAAAQAKLKEEAERQKKAKEAATQAKPKEEATAQAKLKEEAERQKKAKEAEATAQAKQKEETERQKNVKETAAQTKMKEEAERQKKVKETAAQAKLKEEAEHQKKAKEAAVQAKQKEEAERLKKAKEAATQAKLKEEAEHQKKVKEAAVQAKQKEEAEHQKKAKEAAAQVKQKEEAERLKKAKEAATQAKQKEEAERQKKAKEAEATALIKQKEEAERQKKAKEAEATVLAKQKEEAERQKKAKEGVQVAGNDGDETVHLAVVACGDRLEEPQVMIKSAVLLTQAKLHVHIFADDELRPLFKTQLDTWPSWVRNKFKYSLYEIQFPEGENADQWRKLFKLCASQRLFLPYILKDLSAVLYVDTDILFMRPIENVWSFFKRFNSTQIAALTPEHESPNAGWYNRFARHPYYGKLGVNSGVMLMNLTRMRQERWMEHILPYFREYKLRITWGDQDLINIFFHFYPKKLYVYPCNWNYRPDHCMYGSDCKQAEDRGVSVLHGNRGSYHNDKQPTFKAIYQAVRDFQFGDDFETKLLGEMRKRMKNVEGTPCGRLPYVFLSQLERQIKLLKEKSAKKPVVEEDMKVTKQVADSKEKEVKTEKQEKVREERDVAGVSKEEIPAKKNEKEVAPAKAPASPVMHLAVVACGNRFAETLILLKSAVLLTRAKIFFHIFADDDLQPKFKQKLSQWPANVLRQVTYDVRPIQFPSDNTAAWKKLFKPCASQRLFLANILEDVDALLYVDTDVLFFTPLEDVWAHFDAFNSTQLAALAGEMEDTSNSWYKNFARHPYYPPLGVNSGVMLMNLTRMRQVDWLSHIIPYYEEYKFRITWGDQDLINIYFHYFPEQLYVYSCKWNYRHDHCIYMDVCKAVKETGVSVLHGCRRIFQNDKEPAFRAIYLAMEEHQFGDDLGKLLESMKTRYRTAAHTNCGQMEKHFFQQLERHIAARKRDKA